MNFFLPKGGAIVLARPKRVKRGWMKLRVVAIVSETHDTRTFQMVDAEVGGCQFDYHAGQYLTFRFDHFEGRAIARSYTISSSPCQQDFVSITVKRTVGGVVSNWLYDNLHEGAVLRARGALGRFCYDIDRDHPHLFMVAAGSGVTPFLSIIRQFMPSDARGAPQEMSLLVSYRTRRDLIGWQELQAFAKAAHFHLHLTLTGERDRRFLHGRINAALLNTVLAGRIAGKTFMLCGPEAMMQIVTAALLDAGVDAEQIRTESFST